MFIKFTIVIILSSILLGIGQTNIYGQNENFPIPKFETPQQQNIANQLGDAYYQMQQHLCNKQSSEEWRSKFERLYNELVLAQHRTMWAAAGYLDSQLVEYTRTLQPYYVKIDEIRAIVLKASRKNRKYAYVLQNLITNLGENSRRFTEAANSKGFGQSIFVVYANGAALSELDKELTLAKLKLYEIPEAEYLDLRNQALTALTNTIKLIYSYAINYINSKIPTAAPLFAVSTSTDYFSPIQILNTLSNTLSISFDTAKFDTLQDEKWHTYAKKQFNEADFKGNCLKEKVRIMFVPSRRSDAEKSAQLLRSNNFEVDLREVLENAVPDHKGKVYYQNKGNTRRANFISGLVKNIESVSSNKGNDGSDAPDYSLWLIGKKEEAANSSINLSGIWSAEGYKCPADDSPRQVIRIEHKGNQINAFKVVGNSCVVAGSLTFRGNFTQNSFRVEVATSDGPNTPIRYTSGTLQIVNSNLIKLTSEIGNITLTRQVN